MPVLGFLPTLNFLCLIIKVPNDVILTSSLFSSSDIISSKIFSINEDDAEDGNPTFEDIFSIKSFLVQVFFSIFVY